MFLLIMLTAVYLDHQSGRMTVKVYDVVADDFLPVELMPVNLLPADFRPEKLFRVCHIFSESSFEWLEFLVIVEHLFHYIRMFKEKSTLTLLYERRE